jgi:hypothetical protein
VLQGAGVRAIAVAAIVIVAMIVAFARQDLRCFPWPMLRVWLPGAVNWVYYRLYWLI